MNTFSDIDTTAPSPLVDPTPTRPLVDPIPRPLGDPIVPQPVIDPIDEPMIDPIPEPEKDLGVTAGSRLETRIPPFERGYSGFDVAGTLVAAAMTIGPLFGGYLTNVHS